MRLFAVLLTACLLIAPVSAQNGPRVPSDFAPRGSGDDGVAGERVEALELRIAQLEQLLEAQRTLQNRNRLSETRDLQQRLELLETRLLSAQDAFAAPVSAAASKAAGTAAAADRVQFNQLVEMLRLLQIACNVTLSRADRVTLSATPHSASTASPDPSATPAPPMYHARRRLAPAPPPRPTRRG